MHGSAYARPGYGMGGVVSSQGARVLRHTAQVWYWHSARVRTVQTKLRIERYATDSTAPQAVGRGLGLPCACPPATTNVGLPALRCTAGEGVSLLQRRCRPSAYSPPRSSEWPQPDSAHKLRELETLLVTKATLAPLELRQAG